jgi:hypothetical protein
VKAEAAGAAATVAGAAIVEVAAIVGVEDVAVEDVEVVVTKIPSPRDYSLTQLDSCDWGLQLTAQKERCMQASVQISGAEVGVMQWPCFVISRSKGT